MSTAATQVEAPPAPKSNKKLIVILAVVLLLVVAGGVGAFVYLQQQKARAEAQADDEDAPAPKAAAKEVKKDPKALPVFMPLDPFTVNLADRDGSRYAQVSVTLEIDEAKTGDLLKGYMPAVRNNVLLLLSAKTSSQLLDPQGKLDLAREIQGAVLRPLGIEMEEPEEEDDRPSSSRKKRKPRPAPVYPVQAVHFSNFIVQ